MMVKLEDVAKKAGVSLTTASRVINRKGYLSSNTIQKVEDAIAELHYTPNAAARSLQGKSLKLIGLVFPNIQNIFYAELIEKIEQELFKKGYKSMLALTEHDKQKERDYLSLLLSNQVEGIIYGSHNLSPDEYSSIQAPIVAFDRLLTPETTVVGPDNFQGGLLAAEALIQTGSKKIAFFGSTDNPFSITNLRREGFLSSLETRGLEASVLNFSSSLTVTRKSAQIKQTLLEHQFDGIFCTDDLMALLVKNIAQELHQEPYVIGFDGTEFIQNYETSLTTIKQPISDLAELLVELLLKKIAGETLAHSYQLPVKLHIGEL
ncbi:LacI family DNA-binding transcriptional regulator [Lactococcus ileimucosae]|uniref:LacI family DNA-binding transcriptional regulator n=1 Tax=Lactococcus ileimucosae TaxID=2941329 RepID=UPI0035183855